MTHSARRSRPADARLRDTSADVRDVIDQLSVRDFGDRDPVGQVVTFQTHLTTIVGVLRSMHLDGPEAAARPELYVPVDQPFLSGTIPSMGCEGSKHLAPCAMTAKPPMSTYRAPALFRERQRRTRS